VNLVLRAEAIDAGRAKVRRLLAVFGVHRTQARFMAVIR
jgi:hypothetical protein